jgi:hypothetical protein
VIRKQAKDGLFSAIFHGERSELREKYGLAGWRKARHADSELLMPDGRQQHPYLKHLVANSQPSLHTPASQPLLYFRGKDGSIGSRLRLNEPGGRKP